jgi:hypothetical protein
MITYKVLDVRELIIANHGSVSSGSYSGGTGSVNLEVLRRTVVIAEDKNTHRKRFEFYEGYPDRNYHGETVYYGYRGDYDLLVPGDEFVVEETSTYPTVNITKHYSLINV